MRIGFDATFLRPETRYTGMGEYTRGLLTALTSFQHDHKFTVLGFGKRPEFIPASVTWLALPGEDRGRLYAWAGHQRDSAGVVRKLGLDLLHVPGLNMRLSGPGVPLSISCPLVVTMHDAIPLTYYRTSTQKLPWRLRLGFRIALAATRRAAAVITDSATSRDDIVHHTRVAPDRLHVIYCGVDFPPAPPEPQALTTLGRLGLTPPFLLYAGSYEPRKNVQGVIDAYRIARTRHELPPLVLIVERDSGWKSGVLEAVAQSGLQPHLHFIHSLTMAEITAVYHHADLFIYPSFAEGFGLPPVQALACGLPVIAARAGSLPEVLGDAAHFVDPYRPDDMAEAIVRLTTDHPYARSLAERGPAQAAHYGWDTAARETLRVYELAANATTAH